MKLHTTKSAALAAERSNLAEIFKALGHPTRVLVVEALGREERCVCELTELAGCDMSTMSNHLAVMRSAGVLRSERRASQVFYRVAKPCVLDFIKCLRGCP